MSLIAAKCNGCGGQLNDINPDRKTAYCPYCGLEYVIQEVTNRYDTTINILESESSVEHLLEHAENVLRTGDFQATDEILDKALERGGARNHKVHWLKFLSEMKMTQTDTWEDRFSRDMFDEQILEISSSEIADQLSAPHFYNARRFATGTAEVWLTKQYNLLINKFDEMKSVIRQEQEEALTLLNEIYDYVSQKEELESSIDGAKAVISFTPTSFGAIRYRRLESGFPEVVRLILCFLASIILLFLTGVVFNGFDVYLTLRQTMGSPVDALILVPLFIFIPVRFLLFLYHSTLYTIIISIKGRRKIKEYRKEIREYEEHLARLNQKYSPVREMIIETSLQEYQSTEEIGAMIESIKQNKATTIQDAVGLLKAHQPINQFV